MRMIYPLALSFLLVACGAEDTRAAAPAAETRPPNARGQTPAFPSQTRAPAAAVQSRVRQQVIASGLEHPWGLAFLPDGRMLVTEKPGRLRIVTQDGRKLAPIAGLPAVDDRGQGGLLGVAAKPLGGGAFLVCFSYSEPQAGGKNNTAAQCGRAQGSANLSLTDLKLVFRQTPSIKSALHFGGRVVFAPDGALFLTTGERANADTRMLGQDVKTTLGKTIRVRPDGSAPDDNPYRAQGGAAALVWSYGHRNIQGAAIDPATGALWTVEHGPRGGDELNKPEAGKNYGWPVITYGIDYDGKPIGQGITAKAGMEQPVYYWDPVIAPSGMIFYSGALFPAWKGDILIGGLQSQGLVRLTMKDGRVASEERISLGARIRDVAQGPDGAVYVLTDGDEGKIIRLTPG